MASSDSQIEKPPPAAVNSLIVIGSNVLPPLKSTVRTTRSCSNQDISTFTPKNCRTVTYQRSFTVRTCRVWNTLPHHLRLRTVSLESFKNQLYDYYKHALVNVYDPVVVVVVVCLFCYVF